METIKNLPPYQDVFFTHYQCNAWNNPNKIYSLHIIAKGITLSYEFDPSDENKEKEALEEYSSKVQELLNENLILVHWGQTAKKYGVQHLENRYKELGGDKLFPFTDSYPLDKSINLSEFLWDKYGNSYIEHPRLDKLAEKNNFLGNRERELGDRSYGQNRISLITKIYDGEKRGTLKTNLSICQKEKKYTAKEYALAYHIHCTNNKIKYNQLTQEDKERELYHFSNNTIKGNTIRKQLDNIDNLIKQLEIEKGLKERISKIVDEKK
ncbi:MAG: hypothetical protein JSS94_06235 [Bacteroidetes bacterium]|nr:hypothetical protein [Bacteroidota bacterium]